FLNEHYLGSFVRPGLNLVVLTRDNWKNVMKPTYALIQDTILLGIMAVAIAVILVIFLARSITSPLQQLAFATEKVAAGQFDLALDVKSRDEIGALSSSFNVMSQKIQQLITESMERVRLENELAIASTVQQNLFPPKQLKGNGYQIESF